MDLPQKQIFSSKVSIIGLFAFLSLVLTIPLVVLLAQERQTMTGRAAEDPTPEVIKPQITPPQTSSKIILGYVYNDINKNGERDPQEQPIPNVNIIFTQINPDVTSDRKNHNFVTTVVTDINGYFKYKFTNVLADTSSFMVKLVLPPGYKTINSNPVILSGLNQNEMNIVQFGLFSLTAVNPILSPVPTITAHTSSPGGKIIKSD